MSHEDPGGKAPITVVAGILIEAGRVLVTQRKAGAHLGGLWEFPGGKVHAGEDPRSALKREMDEELGIDVEVEAPLEVTFFRYPEKDVLLLFFSIARTARSDSPRALDVAAFQWADLEALGALEFPPADEGALTIVRARLGSNR